MAAEQLNVSGSLMFATTKVEINLMDAVGMEYAESAMTWLRIDAMVADMVELNSKPHGLE